MSNETSRFMAGGARYKVTYDARQQDARIYGLPPELNGQWVALVDATDNCHMKPAPTVKDSLTAAPDGYVLVPRSLDDDEHGDEALSAACDTGGLYRVDFARAWAAAVNVLAAAPQTTADQSTSCRQCYGSGYVTRDPDIGTDQECPACNTISAWANADNAPPAEQSPEHVPGLAGLIAAKTAEIEPLIPWQIRTAEQVAEYTDARRYRRLQILGAAPYGSKNLSKGTVLSFQSLDAFVDADLEAYPSRGEANAAPPAQSPVATVLMCDGQGCADVPLAVAAQSPVAVLQDAPGLDDHAAFEAAMVAAGYHVPERGDAFATQYLFQRDQDRFEGFQMGRAALSQRQDDTELLRACRMAIHHDCNNESIITQGLLDRLAARLGV